tara:strand:- start:3 stop:392 length:390 start_codon:yes stop_codon:yes gene_type:complete
MLRFKGLLLAPLIVGLISPIEAGIYLYPLYREGIEVRCKDGKPMRIVEIKAGRGMKLQGNGNEEYSWPMVYLFPEASDHKYNYFPSTARTQCSYRILTPEEKAALISRTFEICLRDEFVTRKQDCYGWD